MRTTPSNSRPGKLTLFAMTFAPWFIAPRKVSGTVKSSFMVEMSSIDVIGVFGVRSVPGLTLRKTPKIVPMLTFTSMFDEPSSGSKAIA